MDLIRFLLLCLIAMACHAFVAQLLLWAGPNLFWFRPLIEFIRNVGLILIASLAFLVVAAAAIRKVCGEEG